MSTPELTDDGLLVVSASPAEVDGCNVVAGAEVAELPSGTQGVLEVQFLDAQGQPIDLSVFGTTIEGESSATAPPVVARFREATGAGCTVTVDAVVVDAAQGTVRVAIPTEVSNRPGIYRVDTAVVDDDDNIRYVVTSYLHIYGTLFREEGVPAGPPSMDDVRRRLRDFPAYNELLDTYEFKPNELSESLVRPVLDWNETPVVTIVYSTHDFPYRSHWIDAAIGELLMTAAHGYRRNRQKGVANDLQDREAEYTRASMSYRQEWKEFMRIRKRQDNIRGGFGRLGSPYGGSRRW